MARQRGESSLYILRNRSQVPSMLSTDHITMRNIRKCNLRITRVMENSVHACSNVFLSDSKVLTIVTLLKTRCSILRLRATLAPMPCENPCYILPIENCSEYLLLCKMSIIE